MTTSAWCIYGPAIIGIWDGDPICKSHAMVIRLSCSNYPLEPRDRDTGTQGARGGYGGESSGTTTSNIIKHNKSLWACGCVFGKCVRRGLCLSRFCLLMSQLCVPTPAVYCYGCCCVAAWLDMQLLSSSAHGHCHTYLCAAELPPHCYNLISMERTSRLRCCPFALRDKPHLIRRRLW